MRIKILGDTKIMLKKDVVPHKFDCQRENILLKKPRTAALKREHIRNLSDAFKSTFPETQRETYEEPSQSIE